MKIVVLDGHTENPGDLSWAELEQSTRLRMIGVLATGFNVVDIDAAAERCIPVCNVPSYATEAVAQYTFALLLELCHRVGAHDRAVQEGRWTQGKEFCFWDYPQIELNGKTMGLIGYGRIGQAVGRIAAAFGMKVLHFSPSGREGGDSLEEVLRQSDVLSLHCPLTAENHHLINAETLSMVKPGVLLLNTARGSLIDEAALRKALLNGQVAGAAVDVAEREPIPADSPLLGLNNCLGGQRGTPTADGYCGGERPRLPAGKTCQCNQWSESFPLTPVSSSIYPIFLCFPFRLPQGTVPAPFSPHFPFSIRPRA